MAAAPEFHLPLAPADLLRDGGPGRYVVQEVLLARELPPALAGKGSPHPLPGGARSCSASRPSPPASLRVFPQLSGPPSVRGARWPCCSTSTACTACCSEYGARTGRDGTGRALGPLAGALCSPNLRPVFVPQPLPNRGHGCQGGRPGADDARWVLAVSGRRGTNGEVVFPWQLNDDIKANVTRPAGLHPRLTPVIRVCNLGGRC